VKRRKSRKSEAAVVGDDNVGAMLELSRRHEIVVCAKIYGKGAFPGPMDQRCATTAHR
jgi:hypothetical protein